ncbi:MAG TPA: hypothetical protein VG986_03060 [Pseudolabrys sp.]|nr:hypothetical protein [Pseudolabrys sp.]
MKFWIAFAGALMIAGPAAAADTQAAWEGFYTVTSSTTQCSGVGGTGVGSTNVSIYRPKINSSDTNTFLSLIQTRAAIDFQNSSESTIKQMNGSGNYAGSGINSRAKAFSYTATYSNFKVTPSPVTASTTNVMITGTINTMWNTTGCNVTFKATYTKRID